MNDYGINPEELERLCVYFISAKLDLNQALEYTRTNKKWFECIKGCDGKREDCDNRQPYIGSPLEKKTWRSDWMDVEK